MFELFYKTNYLYGRIRELEDRISRLEVVHTKILEGMKLPDRKVYKHPDSLDGNPFEPYENTNPYDTGNKFSKGRKK